MRKQITYKEPYFDPHTHVYDLAQLTEYSVTANNDDEYAAIMSAITNPAREILQDSIIIEDLPDAPVHEPVYWDELAEMVQEGVNDSI